MLVKSAFHCRQDYSTNSAWQ